VTVGARMTLGHVAIRARDIEASARFYRDVVGFREAFRMNTPDGTRLGTIYLYVAPGQFIEIFPDGQGEVPGRDQTGFNHLCVQVDDAAAALAELRARGAPIDTDLRTGYSKCVQFWTHDPDGNRIEFMELPPESLQAQANVRLAWS